MSYGLKKANNKMAMARGAKFMKVHNLPGWYNKEGDLFGETKKLSKENRALRYKLKQANAAAAISRMALMAANSKKTNAEVKHAAALFKLGAKKGALRNAHAKLAIASMATLAANSKKTNANVKRAAALFKLAVPMKRSNALIEESLTPGPPKRINALLSETEPRWTKARQSGVRTYNKSNLKKNFKSSIGPNAHGYGWAKVGNAFYPLVGTRKKGGGYVINRFGKSSPSKYENVVKGFLVW